MFNSGSLVINLAIISLARCSSSFGSCLFNLGALGFPFSCALSLVFYDDLGREVLPPLPFPIQDFITLETGDEVPLMDLSLEGVG